MQMKRNNNQLMVQPITYFVVFTLSMVLKWLCASKLAPIL